MQTCQHDPQRASQAGFQVEYVLQPGAHVLEVSFHGASLHWPYAKSLEMVRLPLESYPPFCSLS